jgi:hypothetical protein
LFQLQKNEPKSLKRLRRAQNWGIIPLTQVGHKGMRWARDRLATIFIHDILN